jgi:hypothetical protein
VEAEGARDLRLEFSPAAKGKPLTAVLQAGRDQEFRFTQAAAIKAPTPAELKEYMGEYVSEELLNAKYRLVLDKDNLVIRFRSAPKKPLKAMAADRFTLGFLNIEFIRKGKKIQGFELSAGRAGHIEFIKK